MNGRINARSGIAGRRIAALDGCRGTTPKRSREPSSPGLIVLNRLHNSSR